jgi:predicted nucleotidyltransferase
MAEKKSKVKSTKAKTLKKTEAKPAKKTTNKAKTTKAKTTTKSIDTKAKSAKTKKEEPSGDMGIVIVDDDIEIDHEKVNEERRAYLEEARSQEAFD